jgi:hypothetical protein
VIGYLGGIISTNANLLAGEGLGVRAVLSECQLNDAENKKGDRLSGLPPFNTDIRIMRNLSQLCVLVI